MTLFWKMEKPEDLWRTGIQPLSKAVREEMARLLDLVNVKALFCQPSSKMIIIDLQSN